MEKIPRSNEKIKAPTRTIKDLELMLVPIEKEIDRLRREPILSKDERAKLDSLIGKRDHARDELARLTLLKLSP